MNMPDTLTIRISFHISRIILCQYQLQIVSSHHHMKQKPPLSLVRKTLERPSHMVSLSPKLQHGFIWFLDLLM